jgi:DNA-binding transcriptional LysR family regulator
LDNLNDILVFVRVVEKRSFTAAARDLQISAPAASKHIGRLEESLGIQLLKRSTRRLSLTDGGSEFYAHCAKAISDLELARDAAVRQNRAVRGMLRAQATVSVAQRLLVPAIRSFIRCYPGISVSLTIGSLPVNLIEHNLDVVFVQSVRGKHASLEYRSFVPLRYFVCAAPSYLEAAGRPQSPRDLVRFNCLVHQTHKGAGEWRFGGRDGDYRVKVRGNFQTNNGVALYEAVTGGLGIARMPDYMAEDDIRAGRLTVLFDNVPSGGRAVIAAYPRRQHPPARLQAFLDFLDGFLDKRIRA